MSINTEKIIHVVSEMIVVFGLVFYFKKTNNQLLLQVNEKFKILEDQIKKQDHIINCLSDKLNNLEVTKHKYDPPEKCKNLFDDKINATYTSFPLKKQTPVHQKSGNQQHRSDINKKSIPLFNLDNLQNIGLGGVVMMGNMANKKKVEFNIEELKDESDDEKNTQKEEICHEKEEEEEEEEEEEDEEEIEKELASELKDLLG